MESLGRSSRLLVFAALVVKATSRIPCAAHQNVDGCCPAILSPSPEMTSQPFTFAYPTPYSFPSALLHHHVPDLPLLPPFVPAQGVGGGTNQPNVITQSVTWGASKKGLKPTSAIETDCPTDEILVEMPNKSMKLLSENRRIVRSESADTEEDLDFKLKRLVRLLDNMQKREERCEWGTCSRPRKTWKKNYWRRKDVEFEDEDFPEQQSMVDYSDEEEERVVRRPKRTRYPKYDGDDAEEAESTPKRVKMVPKMDWVVLKKCPRRCPKKWTRDDQDRCRDSQEAAGSARDILYIPHSEPRDKYRRRIVTDYDR